MATRAELKEGDDVTYYCDTERTYKTGRITRENIPIQWAANSPGVEIDYKITRTYCEVERVKA